MAKLGRPRKHILKENLVAVWTEDRTLADIAEIFGVSMATISSRAEEYGLGKKPYAVRPESDISKQSADRIAVIKRHIETDDTGALSAAARELGISRQAVSALYHAHEGRSTVVGV